MAAKIKYYHFFKMESIKENKKRIDKKGKEKIPTKQKGGWV